MSTNIKMGDSYDLTIKTTTKVQIKGSFEIVGTNTELPVVLEADFKDIPVHLHEPYLQLLRTRINWD
jgi:hypothetical protein